MGRAPGSPHPRVAVTLFLGLAALPLRAQDALAGYVPPQPPDLGGNPVLLVLRTLGSLGLVIGTILAVAWLARQRLALRPMAASRQRLRLLESLPLGNGRNLHLVICGGRALLVGGGEQMSCLLDVAAEEVGYEPGEEAPATFREKLQAVRLEAVPR